MKYLIVIIVYLLVSSCSTKKSEVAECCKTVISVDWEWANANLDGKYWEITTIDCNNNVTVKDVGFSYYPIYEVGDNLCN